MHTSRFHFETKQPLAAACMKSAFCIDRKRRNVSNQDKTIAIAKKHNFL